MNIPESLPGSELVRQGLVDLAEGKDSLTGLLVSIGASRLRHAGLKVPTGLPDADIRLYHLLADHFGDDAHSRYNALLRSLVSFEQALERVASERQRDGLPPTEYEF